MAIHYENIEEKIMGETKQDRYERICNELSDIIIVIEPKSREIIWVNSAVKHILGYEKNDLTGKNYSSLLPDEGSHIKDLDKINIYDAVIEEQEFVRSDGSICAMDVTAGMINWTDEQIAIVITLRDITERKSMREELEKTRKEFIAILTHDLKNPLGAIMNFTNFLEGDLEEEEKRECMNMIRYSGNIMLNLINNIVASSRLETGKMTYNFEKFILEDLLTELKKTFMPAAVEKDITLNFTCQKGTLIYGDKEKIRQIFQNFITNALRYTRKGYITIVAYSKGERVDFEVSDTGCGIAGHEQEKLFQKFTQVTGEKTGTGLGLYIIKQYLEGHGSDIRLESKTGKGTKFFFTLPEG